MAYLDLSLPAGVPIAAPRDVTAAFKALFGAHQPDGLSELEWRVVELARGDSLRTLQPQRRRSWLGRLLLGPTPPSPELSDERLEALRRLAVQAWHMGYTLPASAMKQAFRAGYSDLQIGKVIDTIVGHQLGLAALNGNADRPEPVAMDSSASVAA
jgi:hypothetical protein